MSSEIYYDKAFIRVGRKYIPIVQSGSSNCFQFAHHSGRQVPEKRWHVLQFQRNSKVLFSAEEVIQLADEYGVISDNSGGGIKKTRQTAFGAGEFRSWILAGMKHAKTVEEHSDLHNFITVSGHIGKNGFATDVSTSENLLAALDSLKSYDYVNVAFCLRNINKAPKLGRFRAKEMVTELTASFALMHKTDRKFFCKKTPRSVWVTSQKDNPEIRRFKSVHAAEKYWQTHQPWINKFVVQQIS